jgi:hypothetical protein
MIKWICEKIRDHYFYKWLNRENKEENDGIDILDKYHKWANITRNVK